MMTWSDILKLAESGNLVSDRGRTQKTEKEWRAQLTLEQFRVARQKGTERAFSSEMCSIFESGKYACVCCDTLLFDSEKKFDSGTGWPSFSEPVEACRLAYHKDVSLGAPRIEVLCNTCEAHLGHVFQDAPSSGGLRYCINAVVLKKTD